MKLINVLTVALKCALISAGLVKCPSKWMKFIKKRNGLPSFVSIGTSGEVYPAAGFVSMFKEMNKPTVELNLEPSRNQDQFDFAIHKPATVAVEEFKNLALKNIK